MKILVIPHVLVGFVMTLLLAGCDQAVQAKNDKNEENGKVVLNSEIEQASYLLGYQRAQGLAQQTDGALDMQAFVQGVADFVGGADSEVSIAEQGRLMQALQNAINAKQAEASAGIRQVGEAYRQEYAGRSGVKQLPSGLLYEVLSEGAGEKPGPEDTVTTHYHGMLIDGTVFDSSVDRGQPASFPVNGVIAGWTEALQLMSVGSKWRLVIPPELAYGDRGAGAQIKPGATLVFDVELLDIKSR